MFTKVLNVLPLSRGVVGVVSGLLNSTKTAAARGGKAMSDGAPPVAYRSAAALETLTPQRTAPLVVVCVKGANS
jgi:hypothetical protein